MKKSDFVEPLILPPAVISGDERRLLSACFRKNPDAIFDAAKDNDGKTALLLLRLAPELAFAEKSGKTPATIARKHTHADLARQIDIRAVFHAITNAQRERAVALISDNPSLASALQGGKTPAEAAQVLGFTKLAKEIRSIDAKIVSKKPSAVVLLWKKSAEVWRRLTAHEAPAAPKQTPTHAPAFVRALNH